MEDEYALSKTKASQEIGSPEFSLAEIRIYLVYEPMVVGHDLFPDMKLTQDIMKFERIKIRPTQIVYDHLSSPFKNIFEALNTDEMDRNYLIERKELNYRLWKLAYVMNSDHQSNSHPLTYAEQKGTLSQSFYICLSY